MSIDYSVRMLRLHIASLVSLWRGGGGHGPLTRGEIERAGKALKNLQRGLTGGRNLSGANYMQDSIMLGAYLLYYWPVSYLQVSLALSSRMDVIKKLREKESVRILDLGSGPGAAATALNDLLHVESSIDLVDSSKKAMKQASSLLQGAHTTVTSTVMDLEHLDVSQLKGQYDVILLNHTLNELWEGEEDFIAKRVAFLDQITPLLADDGFLFLGDPALLSTSRNLIAVRDVLVTHGLTILSPCMGDGPCGALSAGENHTCHAEVAWTPSEPMASLALAAGLDRESVKMTFFMFRKGKAQTQEQQENSIVARVVSEGMLNKSGRVRYLLCDGSHRFAFSAKSDDPEAKRQGFQKLQRYDVVEIITPEKRGTGNELSYGFGDLTTIHVLSSIDGLN